MRGCRELPKKDGNGGRGGAFASYRELLENDRNGGGERMYVPVCMCVCVHVCVLVCVLILLRVLTFAPRSYMCSKSRQFKW